MNISESSLAGTVCQAIPAKSKTQDKEVQVDIPLSASASFSERHPNSCCQETKKQMFSRIETDMGNCMKIILTLLVKTKVTELKLELCPYSLIQELREPTKPVVLTL